MIEEWRPVIGYEDLYEVSSLGRIKSADRYVKCIINGIVTKSISKGRILRQRKNRCGYSMVYLCNGKGGEKNCTVHRLVAEAFLPNPEGLPQVNHKDENKTNNAVWNLEWCDVRYNMNYGTRNERISKSRQKRVKMITLNGDIIKEFNSILEAANFVGGHYSHISDCLKGRRKKAYSYKWEYA